jgi:hypothetical protein
MNIHELRERAPARFISEYIKWCEYEPSYDWWESTYEWYTIQMEAFGVRIDNINFSGFYSQGDYAHWSGQINVPALFMEKTGLQLRHLAFHALVLNTSDYHMSIESYRSYGIILTIHDLGSGYYTNEQLIHGLFAGQDYSRVEALVDETKLENDVIAWVKNQWHELYDTLREEYEGLTSEEAYIEYCEANDVEFDEEDSDDGL